MAASTLPPELLGQVFTYSLTEGRTHFEDQPSSSETSNRLTFICLVSKSWRTAALLTHTLWRSLTLPGPLGPRTISNARRWLARAGSLPTSLVLDLRSGHSNRCFDMADCALACPELAEMLVDVGSGRLELRHLGIVCPSTTCFLQFLRAMEVARRTLARARSVQGAVEEPKEGSFTEAPTPTPWSLLQSLSLSILSEWTQWDYFDHPGQDLLTAWTYPIFTSLPPSLTALALHLPSHPHVYADRPDGRALSLPPPILANLTSLELTCDWSAGKVLRLLSHCTHLLFLTLDLNAAYFVRAANDGVDNPNVNTVNGPLDVNAKATLLPTLRSLTFKRTVPQALEYLRFFQRAPHVLRELTVEFTETTRFSHRFHEPDLGIHFIADFLCRLDSDSEACHPNLFDSECTGSTTARYSIALESIHLKNAKLGDVRNLQKLCSPLLKGFKVQFVGDKRAWAWCIRRRCTVA